nr:uncharacterized protein LOC107379849 isoform X1 [Nothobranchius furzeri]
MTQNKELHLPDIRRLRHMMYVCLLLTALSLTLVIWLCRPGGNHLPWKQPNRVTSKPQTSGRKHATHNQIPGNKVVPGRSASLVKVNGTKTLLTSAFLEHRFTKKEVRVIAIVLRSEKVDYRCHLRCENQLNISSGFRFIHHDHFGFPYGAAHIMCPVPLSCESPAHIAITSAASEPKDEMELHFLEVENQRTDSFYFHDFTVCISTMFNFTNALQLVQSLEMFKILGVNRVVVYKTNCSMETQRALNYYAQTGFVEEVPWSLSEFLSVSDYWSPEHNPGVLHYFGQIPALNDCLYRHMYQAKYVAMHDIDELILPQSVDSWVDLLPLLEKNFGVDKCYQFENNVFPNNIVLPPSMPETKPPAQGCWKSVTGVNILEHLYQEPVNLRNVGKSFKIIVNPQAVFTTSVHGVLKSTNGCVWVNRTIARMYHTRSQQQTLLKPGDLIYDGRLLNYSKRLLTAVNKALREIGLLSGDHVC